jgi:hypothetical protein
MPEHPHDVVPDSLREVPLSVGLVVVLDAVLVPLVLRVARVERRARRVLGAAVEARHQVGEAKRLRGHARRCVARVHHCIRYRLRWPGTYSTVNQIRT